MDGDHLFDAAGQRHRHHRLRPRTLRDETSCKAVRMPCQLCVREWVRAGLGRLKGGLIGVVFGGRIQKLRQRLRRQLPVGVVPDVQKLSALVGGYGADLRNGAVEVAADDVGEQCLDTPVVIMDLVGRVPIGICFEVEHDVLIAEVLVDVERQIFDRPGGQQVHFTADRSEVDVAEEQHHVDHRPVEVPLGAGVAEQLPVDVLVAEALVLEAVFDVQVRLGEEFTDRHRRIGGDLDGQDIGRHPGAHAQHVRGARGHGETDDGLIPAGQSGEVQGDNGSDRRGRSHATGLGRGTQVRGEFLAELRRGDGGGEGGGQVIGLGATPQHLAAGE